MKKIFLLLTAAITFFFACKNKEKQTGAAATVSGLDSFLVTDSSWGLITAHTRFEDLQRIYGDSNLKDVRECDLECQDSIDVTKVYPGQKNEITLVWEDTAYHRKISRIDCFGERPDWHSAEGIRIGSGLRDLVKANDTTVSFYGFGWDYGGTVSGYNGGKLEKSRIVYRMDLNLNTGVNDSLYGDVGLDSRMPVVQQVMDQIVVSWILLSFYQPQEE